jgi:uncharacterized protein with HEPN domain
MLLAATTSQTMLVDETRASLDTDIKLQLALTKAIEVIGEAASKITPQTRARFPGVPWVGVIGMRNVLIHAYFNIDLDQLWETATIDLPPLIGQLEEILSLK